MLLTLTVFASLAAIAVGAGAGEVSASSIACTSVYARA
jgi:hypothetical protein